MERQKFEGDWKDAFKQAEVCPSEDVWTNIELGLEKAEGHNMKRRLLFYQSLAAASVIFALAVGGAGIYFMKDNNKFHAASNLQSIALNEDELRSEPELEKASSSEETSENLSGTSRQAEGASTEEKEIQSQKDVPSQSDESPTSNGQGNKTSKSSSTSQTKSTKIGGNSLTLHKSSKSIEQVSVLPKDETNTRAYASPLLAIDGKRQLAFYQQRKITLNLEKQSTADPVSIMLAQLADREREISNVEDEKDKSDSNTGESLWTSVGFSAGSFNTLSPTVSPTASNTFLASSAVADSEVKASGMAYSVGVNMGTKIAERWVLQGGVNYLTQSSDYTAHTAVGTSNFTAFRPASINELDKLNQADAAAETKLVTTAPYNVNNNVRYLSVPMQAGYLVINRKFGLQLNAGVSTDLFVNNTKTAEGQNIDKIDQGRGDESPYRPMNFSGLMGTELSYRFGDRYRIALNPGLRYPFSSIYKTELGVNSTPLTFDVGLRFRYIFH